MGKRTGESKEKRADVFGQIRPDFADRNNAIAFEYCVIFCSLFLVEETLDTLFGSLLKFFRIQLDACNLRVSRKHLV